MRYIAIILFLFNVASAQSLFGVVAGDGSNDAKKFLDSAGITDSAIRAAYTTFVSGWKQNGLWQKTAAFYPLMGGTADSHKWNGKNVRNTDAAYRITWNNGTSGSITHNANGITFNGNSQYARTYLAPSTVASNNSFSMLIYSRTSTAPATNIIDIGAGIGGGANDRTLIAGRLTNGNGLYEVGDFTNTSVTVTGANSQGILAVSRTSATSNKAYRNGSQIGSTNTTTNTYVLPTVDIWIGAMNNNGSPLNSSTRNYCFVAIFNVGLTDSEISTASSLINTLQTALGRNTY